ncbi:uncharacterized protein [Eleutherodactylus coqui]|uniref:uncharacterized protein n=1 Tax=Eleutherodactylus coqui TaxID=57060 RepID=UPI0034630C87
MTNLLRWIQNFRRDPFIFFPKQFNPTFKSDKDFKVEQAGFYMDIYNNLNGHTNGLPVAISYNVRRRKYILCVQDNSVILKEGELPDVPAENSEFIFYRRDFPSEDGTSYTLESSVKSGSYLACSEDGQHVILKPDAKDDRTTRFYFEIIEVMPALNFKVNDFSGKAPYYIQNSHDDFLTAHPEESIATFESDGDTKGERAMFYVNRYNEYDSGNGLPVVFSCRVDNKNYLLSAASNSVSLKEGGLPSEIPTKTSEFIFYIIDFSSGQEALRFESSAAQKFCLAWSVQDTKKTLVLNQYHEDAINERMNFYIEDKSNI